MWFTDFLSRKESALISDDWEMAKAVNYDVKGTNEQENKHYTHHPDPSSSLIFDVRKCLMENSKTRFRHDPHTPTMLSSEEVRSWAKKAYYITNSIITAEGGGVINQQTSKEKFNSCLWT